MAGGSGASIQTVVEVGDDSGPRLAGDREDSSHGSSGKCQGRRATGLRLPEVRGRDSRKGSRERSKMESSRSPEQGQPGDRLVSGSGPGRPEGQSPGPGDGLGPVESATGMALSLVS